MIESIIVASITAGASIICQLIITSASRHKNAIEQAMKEQKLNDRLDANETKLDIHNGYAEKLGDITIALTSLAKDVEYLKRKGE